MMTSTSSSPSSSRAHESPRRAVGIVSAPFDLPVVVVELARESRARA
jgi:hypothetical protein